MWGTNFCSLFEEVSTLHCTKVDYKASFIPCRVDRGHISDKDRLLQHLHEVDGPIQEQVHLHSEFGEEK